MATLWQTLARDRTACLGLALCTLLLALALLAPVLCPYDARRMDAPLMPPSAQHPLGTNDLGYDLLTEWLLGARFSLSLSAGAALLSTAIGVLLGVIAAYWRAAGRLILRTVDVFLAVPRFPLIVLMAAFARPGLPTLLAFFVLFGWPVSARVIYARMLAERQQEYIAAAEVVGVPSARIVARHLLPAALPIGFVRFVGEMQHVIVAESGLSFMGLGDPTARSWGMTLAHAAAYPAVLLTDTWLWWVLPPGLAITIACLGLALIGTGLEPLANPRLRTS